MEKSQKGAFIVLEGIEGAGKSTALRAVTAFLEESGKKVLHTREPGGTPLAEELRNAIKHEWQEKVLPVTEIFVMYASRAQLVENVIRPALSEGTFVVGDRHDLSTVAYQGGGRVLEDVSFDVMGGEIFGIAGISGNGQKELLEAIAGLQPVEAGEISYIDDDQSRTGLIGKNPLEIQKLGVSLSFVPEDRLGMGLVANMNLTDNMMLRSFRSGRSAFADRKSPRNLAVRVVDELSVNTPGIGTPVRRLSGGNVQKVLVGREIASAPTVLLTAYAVRGLDINSSYTIYDLINQQKERGVAVIYVGEDLDVLLELADRILVLCGGKVSGIVDGRTTTKNDVGLMMTSLGGGKAV